MPKSDSGNFLHLHRRFGIDLHGQKQDVINHIPQSRCRHFQVVARSRARLKKLVENALSEGRKIIF